MAISSTGNTNLDKLTSSYKTQDTKKKEDTLGRQDFLTMMMAQIQNQDPLNPMDGTDYSAQLAQFSSLEQLIDLNETMDDMKSSFDKTSDADVTSLIGKKVTGRADSLEVTGGQVSEGVYNLSSPGDVMITIEDSDGNEIRSLYPGQQDTGNHAVNWDGTDNGGNKVDDGSYKFTVMANTGYGFEQLSTKVTGTVDSIVYNDGKAYIEVGGVLIDPNSLVQISDSPASKETSASITDYLGKEITTSNPLASVSNGSVSGNQCSFDLNEKQDIVVEVHNSQGDIVKNIDIASDDTTTGTNTIDWDGTDDSGNPVDDGLYSYSVKSTSGDVEQSTSGEVSGIQYINGNQYLVLNNSGALTGLSNVVSVN